MRHNTLAYKFFLLALFAMRVSSANIQAEEYDLAAYLAKVEQNNPDLALVAKETALAKTGVTQARASFLPSVGLQGGYTRNLTDDMRSTPVASVPGGGPLVYRDLDSNYDNELTLGFGVNQTLFDAGTITNYSRARQGQKIRESSLEAARQNIRCAAQKIYAQTRLVLSIVEIREASERLSHDVYQSTERKYRAGADTELNLLMAEVDWKSKITATAEARKNAELALLAFRNLAGIPLSQDVTLTESFGALPAIPESPALESVLAGRPDYRSLMLSRELSDIEHRAALLSFMPAVSASFSYALGSMGNGSSLVGDYDISSSKLSLNVNIPLFAGGYRLARVAAARIEQEKAHIALSQNRNKIESALLELRLRLDEAAQRLESARLIEETAQRAVALSQSAYANGLITQLTVAEAINRLGEAQLGLSSAIFEYRSLYYDWELATGMQFN
ncbi:adeC/adeK/oprM family multidrug efflux complex outer membrane factor [Spirochaetia bacterium]|nr:adeC/adeK/oprM family multidrug efflux complex outer membrane factor [Spirochaetia bacterium]